MHTQAPSSKAVKQEVIYSGRFLGLKHVDFTIGNKTFHNYEKIFRTRAIPGKVGSIDIIPIIRYKEKKSKLIMNVQFRAPVRGYTLEFPTGTVEQEGTYEENAKRQMLEETGYMVEQFVKTPMPPIYYDPWKSDQDTYCYVATINGDDPASFKGQQLENDEDITIVKFTMDDKLLENVVKYTQDHNLHLQTKVYSLCLGLWLKNNLCLLE